MPYFADNSPFIRYDGDYWITGEDFTLNDINISGVVNVNTNERNGWGETSKTVERPGCLSYQTSLQWQPGFFF
jgi:hypothetical protein